MRILELSLRNYRVFEEVDLELPSRVIGVFGANGAGKSALMESLLFACYGQARTKKDQIRTHGLLTDCEVRVVFEHGGHQYEVRRSIRGRNHATDAELYAGGALLATGVSEVDAEVRRLLHMDHQVFRSSVFAEQKQLDAFSDLTRSRRQEMVLRLLGIKPVDDALAAARKVAREQKGNADRLVGTLPDLGLIERQLAAARAAAAEAEDAAGQAGEVLADGIRRAEAAETSYAESEAVHQEVERLSAERRAKAEESERLSKRVETLSRRIEALQGALARLPGLQEEQSSLVGAAERLQGARRLVEASEELRSIDQEIEVEPVADPAEALAELESATAESARARDSLAESRASRDQLEAQLAGARETLDASAGLDPSQPCPTCGRPLDQSVESYVAHCRKEVARLEKAATKAATALKSAEAARRRAETRLARATGAAQTIQRVVTVRAGLAKDRAKLAARVEALSEPFHGMAPDLAELERMAVREKEVTAELARLEGDRNRLADAESDLDHASRDLEMCRAGIEQVDRDVAKLAFDAEDHARLRKELDEARAVLEDARQAERSAADLAKETRGDVKRLEGEVRRVQEMAEKVGELRDEARYVERVSMLLDGFRGHLVSRIGPELSREAEALFRDLTNREYDDLKIDEETLAIRIADRGTYFDIERFSGSETDLANLALRVAISMHLSRVSGADVGMMVLDEVLGGLDVERRDLMVQAMGKLSGRFHQLFVITHAEQVKDQFPASIEVRKVGRRRSEAVLV